MTYVQKIMKDLDACGWGISGERRREALLAERAPELTEDERWAVIDGVGEISGTKGKLKFQKITLPFDTTITGPNGWLSPDGKFYRCEYHQHSDTAYKIVNALYGNVYDPSTHLDGMGWVKAQFHMGRPHFYGGDLHGGPPPTKKQRDMVVDYCVANKVVDEIPYWCDDKF
jgi:hypothetical protein